MTGSTTFTGGCLCRAVRFTVTGPTKWCAHCHCSLCRRAHGAAFVTWFGVADEQLHVIGDDSTVQWYESTPGARRGFCPTCGSTIFFVSERWPGDTHIVLAAMDSAIDREPSAHVFYDSHVDWVCLGDDLKRLGGDSGTEPLAD